jgi:hypothetical protein
MKSKLQRSWLGFTILVSALYHQSFAQGLDSPEIESLSLEQLMNVTVSVATKLEQNVDDAPDNVMVVTRRQIMDMNARTLKDVLKPIDKIFTDRDTTQAFNAGRKRVFGLDASATYYLESRSYFFINGAKLSTQEQNGNEVFFLPSVYINSGCNAKIKAVNLDLTAYYRGGRPLPPSYILDNSLDAGARIFSANFAATWFRSERFLTYMLV